MARTADYNQPPCAVTPLRYVAVKFLNSGICAAQISDHIPLAGMRTVASCSFRQESRLPGRRDDDVPVLNRPVIPLKVQWPRLTLVAVYRAAGNPRNLPIAYHHFAIGDDSHHP